MRLHNSLLVAALTSVIPAQEETGPSDAVAELAKKLDDSHRPGAAAQELHQFSGILRIETRGRDQDSIEIELSAQYMAPRMIRYRVEEEGEIIERGWDGIGAWDRVGEDVHALGGMEYQEDRAQVAKHRRLAQQLLRFIDPGAVLRSLKNQSEVRNEQLPYAPRGKMREFMTVSGELDSFPMHALDKEPASVRIKMMVDPENKLLRAMQLVPLDEDSSPMGSGEVVLIEDYAEQNGRMLPTRLTTFRIVDRGRMIPDVTVKVFEIDLDPELTREKMARPKG
ncbi:MAG: hypothetical protein ACYTG5_00765 [Planctomycetota bacterium]|jgi:hypothetical protein